MSDSETAPANPGQGARPAQKLDYLAGLDYSVLQQCIHCGMCLPTCPTYVETQRERHGPRGRIALMRAVADGDQEVNEAFAREMYYCLGCLACETACPAGVDYAKLFENARAEIEAKKVLSRPEREFWRWLAVKFIFMRAWRLRLIGRFMWLYQAMGLQWVLRRIGFMRLLPKNLRELEPMAPDVCKHFSEGLIATRETPAVPTRYRVGVMTGCVQDILFSDVNRDTVDVLKANGCEVVTPRNQACCGSLHGHNGEPDLARKLARRAIDQFEPENLDAIISNAGGCGSHIQHYGELLKDDPDYAERARQWDKKFRDIHAWLSEIGLADPGPLPETTVATYHPSCHLHHGQGVIKQPEELLRAIPNLDLTPLPEATWCCGSAGIYNITQPEEAAILQRRKVANIRKTPARLVTTSNPGCHLQLINGLKDDGGELLPVKHTISVLAEAYRANARMGGSAV